MTKVTDRYLEERRQEILDAAQRVFVAKGYSAATMNDIAAEADVAAGSIYRYFQNKSDLIAEVARCCVEEDMQRWEAEAPPGRSSGRSPGEAFLALGQDVRTQSLDPKLVEVATIRLESYLAAARDEQIRGQVTRLLDESAEALTGYIAAAQASGELDASIDPAMFARFLHAFGSGIGDMAVLYGDTFPAAQMWDLLIKFVGSSFSDEFKKHIL